MAENIENPLNNKCLIKFGDSFTIQLDTIEVGTFANDCEYTHIAVLHRPTIAQHKGITKKPTIQRLLGIEFLDSVDLERTQLLLLLDKDKTENTNPPLIVYMDLETRITSRNLLKTISNLSQFALGHEFEQFIKVNSTNFAHLPENIAVKID